MSTENPSEISLPLQAPEVPEKMPYQSQISFTFDVICPWTYLAKKRLDLALAKFRASPSAKDVTFTIKYFPFQLYPDFSKTGEERYDWYLREKYHSNPSLMANYTTLMTAYGAAAAAAGGGSGIPFVFHGPIANTLDAHRLVQHYQEEAGPEVAGKIVDSLYEQYHTLSAHPSSPATLLNAALAAGIERARAEAVVGDAYEGLAEVKMLLAEGRGDGVDEVPVVGFEGRKRDFGCVGAKDVDEYLKQMEQVVKESK